MNCTWVECKEVAAHPQVGKDGEWANLCDKHHAMLDEASTKCANGETGWIPKMLSYWVKAGGGAKKMADRM